MKNYIMIILATLITGIMLNNANVVKADVSADISTTPETTSISTLDTITEKETEEIASSANISVKTTKKTTTVVKTTSNVPNYTISDVNPNEIKEDPGSIIRRANKLVYAHDSNNLLGSIKNLSAGSTFTLTENGITTTYKVVATQIFKKVSKNTLAPCASGYTDCSGTYYMSNLDKGTRFMGKSYSVALFTCDGTSLGGGDATHRRVVFAYQV